MIKRLPRRRSTRGKHTDQARCCPTSSRTFAVDWAPFLNTKWTDAADTHVPLAELKRLAERITTVPENFKLHPRSRA